MLSSVALGSRLDNVLHTLVRLCRQTFCLASEASLPCANTCSLRRLVIRRAKAKGSITDAGGFDNALG